MIFIQDNQSQYITHPAIGEKAKGLFMLQQFDLQVPRWVVLPADFMAEAFKNLTSLSNTRDLLRAIDDYVFPASVEEELRLFFPDDAQLAVRPSAWLEYGHEAAFDGQFDSFLSVPRAEVLQKIKAIWRSTFSAEIMAYRSAHRLGPSLGIAVIIQQVVEAQSSGVAFGLHPDSGNRNDKFVSAVFGVGGASSDMEADTYIISPSGIDRQIARKRARWIITEGGEVTTEEVLRVHQHDQAVADEHLFTLAKALDDLRAANQQFYQLEFAIHEQKIYVVQVKSIWGLNKLPDKAGEYLLWDNAEFAENFSGVITPLMFSCIKEYTVASQKRRASFLGASEKTIKHHRQTFSNAIGLINGRLYSNLRAKQILEAMLPNNRVDIQFVPTPVRTAHTFDIGAVYEGTSNQAWWSMVALMGKMWRRYRALSHQGDEFGKYVGKVIRKYQHLDWKLKSAHELMQLYVQLERSLLNRWDIPAQIDFFFEIHFQWLKKQTLPFVKHDHDSLATDLLLETKSFAALNPLRRKIDIAQKVHASPFLKTLFDTEGEKQIWHFILHDNRDETIKLRHVLEDYLAEVNENGISSAQEDLAMDQHNPLQLIATLQDYLHRHISDLDHAHQVESEIQHAAEETVNHGFRNNPFKRWWYKKTLRKSRELLRMKLDFQYDSQRLWNLVKQLFSVMGSRFTEEGLLEYESDVFFLSKEEIFAFIEGRSITTDLKSLVAVRKEEYERFRAMPATPTQFATYGMAYQSNDFFQPTVEPVVTQSMQGVVSCKGKVQGTVKIWSEDPKDDWKGGEIIVAAVADHRIGRKLSSAAGLLIEGGSIWSPISVLARQMNVPTIVGVENLLSSLKDGDVVEVDGATGTVRKIENTIA